MWLALIGWFVLDSAGREARLASLSSALEGLTVADLARRHAVAAQADQTLRDFMAEVPSGDRSPAYPVLDRLSPAGILPSRRIERTPADEWAVRVRDRMLLLDEVPLLEPDEPALDAMLALTGTGADSALVLEGDRLVGVVHTRDVADALASGRRSPRRRARTGPASKLGRVRPRAVPAPAAQSRHPGDAA